MKSEMFIVLYNKNMKKSPVAKPAHTLLFQASFGEGLMRDDMTQGSSHELQMDMIFITCQHRPDIVFGKHSPRLWQWK